MKDFATASDPLRASSLPQFISCPLSLILKRAQDVKDDNEYSQTGTLIHAGAEAFHKLKSVDSALAIMAHKRMELPLADTAKAQKHFLKYAEKSKEWGEVIETEQRVSFTIPPHETDPTKEEIYIEGTLDQVRLRDATEWIVDIKTGSELLGADMINYHAPQLAAYQLGRKAHRAAIIRTADMLTGGPMFYPCPWTLEHCLTILESVRLFVAQVRSGVSIRLPGKQCRRCPAAMLGNCLHGRLAVTPNTHAAPVKTVSEMF